MNTLLVCAHYIFWIVSVSVFVLTRRIKSRLSAMHRHVYEQLGSNSLLIKFVLHREYVKLGDKKLTQLFDAFAIMIVVAGTLGLYIFIMTPSSGVRLDFWSAS